MTARPKPPAMAMLDTPDEVETAFYDALQQGRIDALMALWADDEEIVCIHPGGTRLIGAVAIRHAFEAMFANGGISLKPQRQQRLQHSDFAVHHLLEAVDVLTSQGPQTAWVLATNVYVKTARGWRLAAHHASPGTAEAPAEAMRSDAPSTLH